MESWGVRTQRYVDALMSWLHWHNIPKSQAFFLLNLLMAVANTVGVLISCHIVPSWWVPAVALPGGLLTGFLVRQAYTNRAKDRRAEERNALTGRDVPSPDRWLFITGLCACFWGAWALLFPHDITWAMYFSVFWLQCKARASPRYPKPPEKRVFVPAHSTG